MKDLSKAGKDLQWFITKSNALGLFNGVNGYFYPFNKLTRAQALAVAIRSTDWYQDESGSKWYEGYYKILSDRGVADKLDWDYNSLDNVNITRGEVALLLYYISN